LTADPKLSLPKKLALFGSLTLALIVWLVVALTLSNEPPMARFLIGAVAGGLVGVVIVIVATTLAAAGAVRAIWKGSRESDHE
jgi:pilus assembly protein TadC